MQVSMNMYIFVVILRMLNVHALHIGGSQVVRALDSLDEFTDLNNGMKPGQSSVFDSAQQSAQIRMFRRMAFGSQDSSSFFNDSQSSWRSRDQDSTTMFSQNKTGPWNV